VLIFVYPSTSSTRQTAERIKSYKVSIDEINCADGNRSTLTSRLVRWLRSDKQKCSCTFKTNENNVKYNNMSPDPPLNHHQTQSHYCGGGDDEV
jgi:hypothetical protein